MKLKKLLSFALALAMVLAFIPAMSLTASAADATVVSSKTTTYRITNNSDYPVIVEYRDGTTDKTSTDTSYHDLYVYHSNWNQRNGLLGFTVPADYIPGDKVILRLYSNGYSAANASSTECNNVVTVGSVATNDWTVDEYMDTDTLNVPAFSTIQNNTTTIPDGFEIIAQKQITSASQWYEFDVTDYVAKTSTAGDDISFVLTHIQSVAADGNHTAINQSFAGSSKGEYAPQLVFTPASDVTVTYQSASGETLATSVETGYVGEEYQFTTSVNDNYVIIEKDGASDGVYGYIAEILESPSITVAESNNAVTVIVNTIYEIISDGNLIPDGEDIESWTLGAGGTIGVEGSSLDNGSITVSSAPVLSDRVHSGSYSAKSTVGWSSGDGGGWNSNKSIVFRSDVNTNSKYYFAISIYFGGTQGTEMTIGTLSEADNNATLQGFDGSKTLTNGGITSSEDPTTKDADLGKFYANCNGQWNQLSYTVTTDDDSSQFMAAFYWLCDAGTSYFDDSMLYEVVDYVEEAAYTVTRNYYIDSVAEENLIYTETQQGLTGYRNPTFADYYYTVDGMNTLYYAEGKEYTEAAEENIVLTPLENDDAGGLTNGDTYENNGTYYRIASDNLIPNGNFKYDLNGWYTGAKTEASTDYFTINSSAGTVTTTYGSHNTDYALYRAWAIEDNKTYLLTYYTSSASAYDIFALTNTVLNDMDSSTNVNAYEDITLIGQTDNATGTNYFIFSTTENAYAGYKYLRYLCRWGSHDIGQFGLYEIEEMDLGVDLVSGAQIRIGDGLDKDTNKVIPDNSGLRFIATITSENTLAQLVLDETVNGEVGIAIVPSEDTVVTADNAVPATKWQLDGKVFSVAVVDIVAENYNTEYYAIPYVRIGETYYTGDGFGRTPYQVAKGLLVDNDQPADYTQSAGDTTLYKVLNAYANETGARLTLTGTEGSYVVTAQDGAYTNSEEFFTVDSTDNNDGTVTITLTGASSSVKFYDYWADYIRINKNHTKVAESVDAGEISADGNTLTFTFTVPAAE